MSSNDIKWKVAELMVECEEYDDLKDDHCDLEEEIEEAETRREIKKKMNEFKKLKRKMEVMEEGILSRWDEVKHPLENNDDVKIISGGDTCFMINVVRVRKEINLLLSPKNK